MALKRVSGAQRSRQQQHLYTPASSSEMARNIRHRLSRVNWIKFTVIATGEWTHDFGSNWWLGPEKARYGVACVRGVCFDTCWITRQQWGPPVRLSGWQAAHTTAAMAFVELGVCPAAYCSTAAPCDSATIKGLHRLPVAQVTRFYPCFNVSRAQQRWQQLPPPLVLLEHLRLRINPPAASPCLPPPL